MNIKYYELIYDSTVSPHYRTMNIKYDEFVYDSTVSPYYHTMNIKYDELIYDSAVSPYYRTSMNINMMNSYMIVPYYEYKI